MKKLMISTLALLAAALCTSELRADLGIKVKHVLVISIDGMHSLDMALWVKAYPGSNLAQLMSTSVNYTNAWTTKNSDSIPSTAGIFTGGTPAVTGMYYDDAYNRAWSPAGSNCASVGVVIDLKQGWDITPTALDGGGGIDPKKAPLNPAAGCTPVLPHNMLRVNTVFEVIRAAGGRTAYSEKRPSYEFLNGPSGTGVQDLYAPEIAYTNPNAPANNTLNSIVETENFDQLRVVSIINEIDGMTHDRGAAAPVPTIFGMNFQSINAAKKDDPTVTNMDGTFSGSGYLDSFSNPSLALQGALTYVDGALGQIVAELKARNLFNSTAIVITAKHGEAPLDPNRRTIMSTTAIATLLDGAIPNKKITTKTSALIWLTNQSQTAQAVALLTKPANQAALNIAQVLSGESLKLLFPDPLVDPAVPDIIVLTNTGGNYEPGGSTVWAEHGGIGENEGHVPLFVSFPRWTASTQKQPVTTTQIAPTVLTILALNPVALQAVQMEGTMPLPAVVTQYLTHLF
jgi:hypothetical protein